MLAVIMYFAIIVFFVFYDLIPIINNKSRKASTVYIIFILFSFILDVCLSFHIKLPSPAVPIKKLIVSIFGLQE